MEDLIALTDAMGTLAGDGAIRGAMGHRARERAGRLSWDRGATMALSAIREAAA